MLKKIQARWYALIEQHHLDTKTGNVDINFHMLPNGIVQDIEIKGTTTEQTLASLCVQAIKASEPFEPLPESLRQVVGDKPREVILRFQYR